MSEPSVLSPEVRALLAGPNIAHLASVRRDGSPSSHPVWVGLDGDRIFFSTRATSPKVRNVEHNPRVALSVVAAHDPYLEAMIRGTVVEVRSDYDWAAIDALALVYTGKPFPMHNPGQVVVEIEPTWARHQKLPFEPVCDSPA